MCDPKHLGSMWVWSVVDANAWVFMHWRPFVVFRGVSFCWQFVSLSVTVFLDRCTHTVAQVRVLFTPSSSSCFIRTLSDLFDLSMHFISYLFISLFFLLFLHLETFCFLNVVDIKSAHFRLGAGPPWPKQILHRSRAQRQFITGAYVKNGEHDARGPNMFKHH